jgi:purine-binding chemotaxis protein CheW
MNWTHDGAAGAAALEARLAGKYMTFKLADETYGVAILKVRELIRLMEITRVPGTRSFIRGVINLRGKVIPVIDLRLKFGMERLQATDQTVIVVVQYQFHDQELTMGTLVDEVLEVLDIHAESIEPPPNFGTGAIDTAFILGVGQADKRVIFLLDIDKVLSAEEQRDVQDAAGEPHEAAKEEASHEHANA